MLTTATPCAGSGGVLGLEEGDTGGLTAEQLQDVLVAIAVAEAEIDARG